MKRKHSLEEYVVMGQLIKNANNAIAAILDYDKEHNMLVTKDIDRLIKQKNAPALANIRSRLDDKMFVDHPYLTNDAFSVFYHDDETVTADELREAANKVQ